MGSPTKSINERVSWLELLKLLQLPITSEALPANTRCPGCTKGRMLILTDHLCGGQWHWCQDCNLSGDMIELAAKVWGLSIQATVAKLYTKGFSLSLENRLIETYVSQHVEARAKAAKLWQAAQTGLINRSMSAARLVHKFSLGSSSSTVPNPNGMARLVGALARTHICETLYAEPGASTIPFKDRKKLKWEDVLVMPVRDLPGRVCSLYCVGRLGRPVEDVVLVNMQIRTGLGERHRLQGLIFHPDVYSTSWGAWDSHIFAIDNPLLAARLQAKHLDNDSRVLPIVSWHAEPNQLGHAWKIFPGRRMVFWAYRGLNHRVLHNAINCDGKIAVCGPTDASPEALSSYVGEYTSEQLLSRILRSAKPWSEVFSDFVSSSSDAEVEELLMQLRLEGVDISRVTKHCQHKAQRRIHGMLRNQDTGRVLTFDGDEIAERSDGWYVNNRDSSELIMEARLVLENFITQKGNEQQFYHGKIIYHGEEIEFCADQKEFNRNPLGWIENKLIEEGKGLLRYNPRWRHKIVQIALRFHQPRFMQGAELVGWDRGRSAFVFPKFHVATDGTVKPHRLGIFPKTAPCQQFEAPRELSGMDVEAMFAATGDTSDIFWALYVAAVSNILAPAFNKQTSGIAIIGQGVDTICQSLTEAIGCRVYRIANTTDPGWLLNYETEHNWPTMFIRHQQLHKLLTWIDPQHRWEATHNCFVRLGWLHAMVKKLTGGWHIVSSEQPASITTEAAAAAPVFLSSYLHDLCRRRLVWRKQVQVDTWYEQVMHDVAGYAETLGLPAERVFGGQSIVSPEIPCGYATAFAEITGELMRNGKWLLCPAGFEDPKHPCLIQVTEGLSEPGIRVNKQQLAETLGQHQVIFTDMLRISAVLNKAGVLLQDADDAWTVKDQWWMAHVRKASATQSGLLRIVS